MKAASMITHCDASKGKTTRIGWRSSARVLAVDVPFVLLMSALAVALLVQRVYHTYVVPIAESYKRSNTGDLFFEDFENDFTYYNRHCGVDDISTRSADDLLIRENQTATQAADVMLEHGAVAFQNVLGNDTATALKDYLAQLHHKKETLGYTEVMWDEISRLSLGIGTRDHPVIAQAMREVGTHPVVKKTLEGILGPDPAIVEISTLTALNGAGDQGIHTDSDFFGSSLLYSRTFLHSYSMFIALQDTHKYMGATTLCPGTHFCADQDLADLCLYNGAFEVSTNGHTGEDGMLLKGDALLFNQNVWHRGPKNIDPDGTDRFMFIMTFASAKDVAEDRRRQGLGTYYYMRFNMWGATFSMLKDATTRMVQPFAGLRALGFVKTRGITWIHQFCQQFANGEEFYEDSLIDDLHDKVFNYYRIPSFLLSQSERWAEYIPETMSLWIVFLGIANVVAMVCYYIVCATVRLIGGPKAASGRVYRRPLSIAATIGLVSLGVSWVIDQTELAQSVTTGDVFIKPFPPKSEAARSKPLGPTTFPERHDVLISTRFDARFLASFNRFLNFHPGNRRWESMVASAAQVPQNLLGLAVQSVVRDTLQYTEDGMPTRFLLQDPYTGSWTLMTEGEASKETQRAVLGTHSPLIGVLATQVKYLLANSRFGVHRGTAMAHWTERQLSDCLLPIVYGEGLHSPSPKEKIESKNAIAIRRLFPAVRSKSKTRSALDRRPVRSAFPAIEPLVDRDDDDDFRLGDKVWVYYKKGEYWYEGKVTKKLGKRLFVIYDYNSAYYQKVRINDIRPYLLIKEGDELLVIDESGDDEEYFPVTIKKVHPDGRCSIEFEDGDVVDKVGRQHFVLPDSDPDS